MAGLAVLGLLAVVLAGCNTVMGPGTHATPLVSGRVLAADTRQPLAGVKVLRAGAGQATDTIDQPKGAQLLQQARPVMTNTNGDFVFPSESYITLFRRATWCSLRLSFQAAHFATLQTNFTTAQATNSLPDGTPVVDAGEILLKPFPK